MPAARLPKLALALALVLLPVGLACNSTSSDGESSGAADFDPLEFYGPCDGPRCGRGSGLSIHSIGGESDTCVCVAGCEGDDASCPSPDDYAGTPVCRDGGDFGGGRCTLPCASDSDCPATTRCASGECQFDVEP